MMLLRKPDLWLVLIAVVGAVLAGVAFWAENAAGAGVTREQLLVVGEVLGIIVVLASLAAILALSLPRFQQRPASAGEERLPAQKGAPPELHDVFAELERIRQLAEERKTALEIADRTHTELVREVNHRIKNNLQVISSLLSLQSSREHQPDARAALNEARQRVSALALIHRHLYDAPDFRSLDFKSFASDLVQHVREAAGEPAVMHVAARVVAPPLRIVADQAVPIALLVTEALAHALKHGFPEGRSGQVTVSLSESTGTGTLEIVNDGVESPGLEIDPSGGLGSLLMSGYVRQLQGKLDVQHRAAGNAVVVVFPLRPALDGHERSLAEARPRASG